MEDSTTTALVDALMADETPVEADASEKPVVEESQTTDETETDDAEDKPEKESEDEQQPDDGLITLPLSEKDGTPVRVTKETLQEWRENGLRLSDYTRNVQEAVAKQKHYEAVAAETQRKQQELAQREVMQLEQMQEAMLAAAAPELQGVNWEQLAATDMTLFTQLRLKQERLAATWKHVEQKKLGIQASLAEAAAKAEQEQRQAAIAEATEKLPQVIPQWSDGYYNELMTYAVKEFGFDPDSVLQSTDWKAFRVLHDAYQYHKLQAAKPVAQDKLRQLPKPIKPGANVSKNANPHAQELSAARKELKQTGSAKALEQMFKLGAF